MELAFPVIPIFISCIISTYFIVSSINLSKENSPGNVLKGKATIAILSITFVYVLFNIPVFVNYVLFTIDVIRGYSYPGPFYSSPLMYWYSWNFTYVICVGVNATVNPVIYFCFMKGFKIFSLNLLRQRRGAVRRSWSKDMGDESLRTDC